MSVYKNLSPWKENFFVLFELPPRSPNFESVMCVERSQIMNKLMRGEASVVNLNIHILNYHRSFFHLQVDVYSFGVLLCEMSIRKLPNPDRRDEQVAMVTDRMFRALIRRCLHQDPQDRPSMEHMIGELEKLV